MSVDGSGVSAKTSQFVYVHVGFTSHCVSVHVIGEYGSPFVCYSCMLSHSVPPKRKHDHYAKLLSLVYIQHTDHSTWYVHVRPTHS